MQDSEHSLTKKKYQVRSIKFIKHEDEQKHKAQGHSIKISAVTHLLQPDIMKAPF